MESVAAEGDFSDGCAAFAWGALNGYMFGELNEHEDSSRKPPFCIPQSSTFEDVVQTIAFRVAKAEKLGEYPAAQAISKVAEAEYPCVCDLARALI
jgi:hypothetical protein